MPPPRKEQTVAERQVFAESVHRIGLQLEIPTFVEQDIKGLFFRFLPLDLLTGEIRPVLRERIQEGGEIKEK